MPDPYAEQPDISVDLNKTRSVHSSRRNSVITLKFLTGPLHQRRNRQTVRKARVEREASLELIRPITRCHVGDGHRNRQVLPRKVHNRIRIRRHFARHREFERAVHRLGRRNDGQGAERGQVDVRQRLRARARHDEHLNGGESKARRSTRQERRRRRSLFLREAIEAILLAFLGQDGADQCDQRALVTRVGGEDGLGFGERSENDVGEGLGEGDGLSEGGHGELVLAGFDRGLVGIHEDAVNTQGMQFLLLWERSAY